MSELNATLFIAKRPDGHIICHHIFSEFPDMVKLPETYEILHTEPISGTSKEVIKLLEIHARKWAAKEGKAIVNLA